MLVRAVTASSAGGAVASLSQMNEWLENLAYSAYFDSFGAVRPQTASASMSLRYVGYGLECVASACTPSTRRLQVKHSSESSVLHHCSAELSLV